MSNFKKLENIFKANGVKEIPDSFKEINRLRNIVGVTREAKRLLDDPAAFLINICDLDINDHIAKILMCLAINAKTVVINSSVSQLDESIIKLISSIEKYNDIVSADTNMITHYLKCDNKGFNDIISAMFIISSGTDLKENVIDYHFCTSKPQKLERGIYFIDEKIKSEMQDIAPFRYEFLGPITNHGVVLIEPELDFKLMRDRWVMYPNLSSDERILKSLNVNGCNNIEFAKKYMDGYISTPIIPVNDINTLFVVNDGLDALILFTDKNLERTMLYKFSCADIGSVAMLYSLEVISHMMSNKMNLVICEGVVPYITEIIVDILRRVCGADFVDVFNYDLDMDLDVYDHISDLIDNKVQLIYNTKTIVNSIVEYLKDEDITPSINLLLLMSRYMRELDKPEEVEELDPFSDSLTTEEKKLVLDKCRGDFQYFVNAVMKPIIDKHHNGFSHCKEIDSLIESLDDNITHILTDNVTGNVDINMALLSGMWYFVKGMTVHVGAECEKGKKFYKIWTSIVEELPSYMKARTGGIFYIHFDHDFVPIVLCGSVIRRFVSGRDIINDKSTIPSHTLYIPLSTLYVSNVDLKNHNLWVKDDTQHYLNTPSSTPSATTILLDTSLNDTCKYLTNGMYRLGVDTSIHKDNMPLMDYIDKDVYIHQRDNGLQVFYKGDLIHTVK